MVGLMFSDDRSVVYGCVTSELVSNEKLPGGALATRK